MSKYYLIAHSLEKEDYRILPLMSKWYIGNGDSVLRKENPIEAIDLVTMRFKNADCMAKRLTDSGYIPNSNYEFFVVHRLRKNGSDSIRIHEVLYNKKQERCEYFRRIALESLNTDLKGSEKNLRLFDRFLNKLYYIPEYRRVIQEGLSSIPDKVTTIYQDCDKRNTPPYFLKYRNPWIMNDYGISRSILESFNRFDELTTYEKHVSYFDRFADHYSGMEDALLRITSPEYLNGQLTLDLSVPKEEKLNYTLRTLCNMNITEIRNQDKQYSLNFDFDVEEKDTKKMRISKRLLKNTYWYLFHKMKLEGEHYSYGNMSVLQEDMDADYRDIVKSLSKESVLNSAYDFCLLYNKYKDRQKVDGAYQKGRGTK